MRYLKLFPILFIITLLASCAGSRPDITIPAQQPLRTERINHPDVALVLSGGGARGMAHIGVIKVLHDAGVPVDLVAGTSAGSIMGALYADHGSAQQVSDAFNDVGLFSLIDFNNYPRKSGIFEGYRLQKFLLNHMQAKDFSQLTIPLIVTTTDLSTGEPFYITSGPIAPAVQASAALPSLFNPVHLYGHVLIDGGMSTPMPVAYVKSLHPKVIIAVNVVEELPQQLPTTANEIGQRAMEIRDITLTRYSGMGADITIRPAVGHTGVFDVNKKAALIAAGEAAAKHDLPKILALLKAKHIPLRKPSLTAAKIP